MRGAQARTGDGLRVRGLRKSYRNRPVIRDVSVDLARGEVVALLGPNGSGKTTCFYCIAGLVPPDAGQVLIDGQDATRLPMFRRARMGIGYLPQEMSIFRGLSVEQNIMAVLEVVHEDPRHRRDRLEELLGDFSIGHLRGAPALALSGERRRVEIARCLASDPSFLLLDEPFAGVDPIAVGEIRGLVHDLKRARGIGVLITDHNVRETLGIVDRAYILHDGHVLMSERTAEIVADPKVREVYLGESFQMS